MSPKEGVESAVWEEQEELRDSLLLDIYGGLLAQKQREALHMQLDLDYSLSEIAENQGVTRQAALDAVKRGIARLRELEKSLRIYERFARSMEVLARMEALAKRQGNQEMLEALREARSIWED